MCNNIYKESLIQKIMKKGLLIFGFLGIIILCSSIILAEKENNEGVPSLLSQIKNILSEILDKLNIIAEKETTVEVNVEPPEVIVEPNITLTPEINVNPEVTIEGGNEMVKRGNLILRRAEYVTLSGGPVVEAKTNAPLYIALPNGNCSITLSKTGGVYRVRTFNGIGEGSGFNCQTGDLCSGNVIIDEEDYMISIKPVDSSYNQMYLAYNCK